MNLLQRLKEHRYKLLPALLVIVGIVTVVLFRQQLVAWFTGDSDESGSVQAPGHAGHGLGAPAASAPPKQGQPDQEQNVPDLPEHQFDAQGLARLQEAFAAYEQIRALLAHDTLKGTRDYASAIALALKSVAAANTAMPPEVSRALGEAGKAAESLSKAPDIEAARSHFGELSRYLVALSTSDSRLAAGLHIFKCPMAKGFAKWFQPSPKLENPYMGQRMPECGSRSDWSEPKPEAAAAHQHSDGEAGEIAYYTCPMHPSVKQQSPGQCPICGMDLTPVTKGELESGIIFVDEARRQRIGVRTAAASLKQVNLRIRAVGEVKVDETSLTDVNLRMSGWVQRLSANETGQRVTRGQTLFTLYSPELYAAQLEHLATMRRQAESASEMLAGLARASRQRLRLLGMTEAQLNELEKRGEAWEHVPVTAPASGYIIEKDVVEGARVEAGTRVYRIADLSRIWVDAQVYESDLSHVRKGQEVRVVLPYVPDKVYTGSVDFIYPTLQGETRTGRVRVVLKNPDLELKPNMYANVELGVSLGERLTIPDSAVVYTGPRRLVFVDLGEGRLRPKVVQLGVHAEGVYEVKDGLVAGDVVVTSGNFLIAAESRLRSATDYWEGSDGSK